MSENNENTRKISTEELLNLIFDKFRDKRNELWEKAIRVTFALFLTEYCEEELLEFLKEHNVDVDSFETEICDYMEKIIEKFDESNDSDEYLDDSDGYDDSDEYLDDSDGYDDFNEDPDIDDEYY